MMQSGNAATYTVHSTLCASASQMSAANIRNSQAQQKHHHQVTQHSKGIMTATMEGMQCGNMRRPLQAAYTPAMQRRNPVLLPASTGPLCLNRRRCARMHAEVPPVTTLYAAERWHSRGCPACHSTATTQQCHSNSCRAPGRKSPARLVCSNTQSSASRNRGMRHRVVPAACVHTQPLRQLV